MALNIPVGISNFTEIRSNNYYYVDKTNLIYELLQSPGTEVTMITRPRRFGKTLAMSMLESFFDIRKASKVLFEGLVLNISPFVVAHDGCIPVMRVTTEGASSSVSIQKSHPISIILSLNSAI